MVSNDTNDPRGRQVPRGRLSRLSQFGRLAGSVAGGKIAEIPITFTDRIRGTTKADFAESKRSIGELLHIARITWLGH